MNNGKKYISKKIQIITYIVIGIIIIVTVAVEMWNIIDVPSAFAFIMLSFILVPPGIFGLINNEILLGNGGPLVYNKNSIIGKIANIFIIIFGLVLFAFGVFAILS
jgi:hypothetical protein